MSGKPDRPEEARRTTGAGNASGQTRTGTVGQVDKSGLPISTPRRVRDKEHLHHIASQPCLICGRSPGHAHHIRFAQPRALGRKVSDEWTVPLCATHHRSLHTVGDEEEWWKARAIDPIACAERLWQQSRNGVSEKLDCARAFVAPGVD
jgi:hypothetical protein